MKPSINIFWFRRDLRLVDNAGLYYALKQKLPLVSVFIFDRNILDDLENKSDRRVQFIYDAVTEMQTCLRDIGSTLQVHYGRPEEVFGKLLEEYAIVSVFTNEDYEPYARDRDKRVQALLEAQHASFKSYKDQVIFSKDEILKSDGKPYTVFTPYSKVWKQKLEKFFLKAYPVDKYTANFFRQPPRPIPSLQEMGFSPVAEGFPARELAPELISDYGKTRDYPAIPGTSRMGVHLRFGTISVRELVRRAKTLSDVYLNELIWREFYQMILWHFPQVGQGRAFKPEYDRIRWRNNETEFKAWCEGQTGYPLVDAGMRQLNATGFMHNRVRMVVASFLAKHLLIDWRWGESYFAAHLLDFDMAANNGGWQWAAGCGCDAAPFFRIFNPTLQAKRFDAKQVYIRKWVPEFEDPSYPKPIVDHQFARERCLDTYRKALAE